jgi:hypothetical protein
MDPRYVTDWSAIIEGLRHKGFTFAQLSACTGIPQPTLIRFRDGGCPKHPDGETLVALWCALTLSTREQVPVAPRLLNGNARK